MLKSVSTNFTPQKNMNYHKYFVGLGIFRYFVGPKLITLSEIVQFFTRFFMTLKTRFIYR